MGEDASHLYRVVDAGFKPVVAFKEAQDKGHSGYAGQLQQAFVKGVIEPVGEWHRDVSVGVGCPHRLGLGDAGCSTAVESLVGGWGGFGFGRGFGFALWWAHVFFSRVSFFAFSPILGLT